MVTTDRWVMLGAQVLLGLTLAVALVGTLASWIRLRNGAIKANVERGNESMNALYVLYGFATVSLTMAIQVSSWGDGYKATLVLIDYAVLTYLFFFNSWFRNRLVFRALGRMRRD